jgi:hypothetical protein
VHDLDLEGPPGWRETADDSGTVMLVVSHVLPVADDMVDALTFETRRGMVCAGPVGFGERGPEEGGEPRVTVLLDPVGMLMELAQDVCDHILSLDEAKRRAREMERTWEILAERHQLSAETMVDLLFRDEFRAHRGLVEFMYVYWRLVAEVADACGTETAWRVAALSTVESAVPLIADRCERAVFEESDAVAARLIERLSEPAELEGALLAAARLRTATRGPEDFAADDYARRGQTTWSARLTSDLYRTWFTDEEPFQAQSHRLVVEAGELVLKALELDGGARRPRLLVSLAQILADEGGVRQDFARAALSALLDTPALREPDLVLFLLRVVDGVPSETVGGLLTPVFGTPMADFLAAYGTTVAAKGARCTRSSLTCRTSARAACPDSAGCCATSCTRRSGSSWRRARRCLSG